MARVLASSMLALLTAPSVALAAAPRTPPAPGRVGSGVEVNREAQRHLNEDYLKPSPGRVALQVESTGKPQTVGVFLNALEQEVHYRSGRTSGSYVDTKLHARRLCTTPCTLHVPPGAFPLVTEGDGLIRQRNEVWVPDGGTRVRVRAASELRSFGGAMLAALAIPTAGVGLLVLAFADDKGKAVPWLAGAGVGGAAATYLLVTSRTGVAEQGPVTPGVAAGVALVPGGAAAGVSGRF